MQNKQRNVQSTSYSLMPSTLPRRNFLPQGHLPHSEPSMTAHGMEYPVLSGQFGSARLAVSPPGFW